MITLCIILAYLLVGLVAAHWSTPSLVKRHTGMIIGYRYPYIKEYPIYSKSPDGEVRRGRVQLDQALMWAFWPVMTPMLFLYREIDKYDPNVLRKQRERIAELERELGIGND